MLEYVLKKECETEVNNIIEYGTQIHKCPLCSLQMTCTLNKRSVIDSLTFDTGILPAIELFEYEYKCACSAILKYEKKIQLQYDLSDNNG